MAPMKGRRYEAKAKMPAKVRGRYIGKVKGKMAPMKGRRYEAKAPQDGAREGTPLQGQSLLQEGLLG